MANPVYEDSIKDITNLRGTTDVEIAKLQPLELSVDSDNSDYGYRVVNNPFSVPDYDPDDLENSDPDIMQLHRSIKANGVQTPLLVRQMSTNPEKYQILSGYRRKAVCEKLGIKTVPVTIVDCDDDGAVIIATTSNIQRKHISLLDKIRAYGLLYRAKRHQGKKDEQNAKSTAEVVEDMVGVKSRVIQQYSSLLDLNDGLLLLVGEQKRNSDKQVRLSLRAGEYISKLTPAQQEKIEKILQDRPEVVISIKAADELKQKFEKDKDYSAEKIIEDLGSQTKKASHSKKKSNDWDKVLGYFPNEGKGKVINRVCLFLDKWKEANCPDDFDIVSKNVANTD